MLFLTCLNFIPTLVTKDLRPEDGLSSPSEVHEVKSAQSSILSCPQKRIVSETVLPVIRLAAAQGPPSNAATLASKWHHDQFVSGQFLSPPPFIHINMLRDKQAN